MARIKIELPEEFIFSTSIPVRITDLNYGGHVGNDTVLSIMHEARVQFLNSHGYRELDFAGVGLIMSDVSIDFKSELFYGDTVEAQLGIGNLTGVAFDLYYKLQKSENGQTVPVAFAKTGMVCYDYQRKKIVALPAVARAKLIRNAKQVN